MSTPGQAIERDLRHTVPAELERDDGEMVGRIAVGSLRQARPNGQGIFAEEETAKVEDMGAEFLDGALLLGAAPAGFGVLGCEERLLHGDELESADNPASRCRLGPRDG